MRTEGIAADAIRPVIEGLRLRPCSPPDGEALSRLYNAMDAADGVPWRATGAEVENWLGHARDAFDARRDMVIVERDGALLAEGHVEWVDTTDALREYRIGVAVHPDWQRRGIGRWLLRMAEEHALQLARSHPSERPGVFGAWLPETRAAQRRLLEEEGYRPARWFIEMVRPSLDDLGELPTLPAGLELRPVGDDDLRRLWDADVEAFQDHWGGFDGSEARFREWVSDPKFDPSLFVVAWDGEEIAGGVTNEINVAENEAFGRRRGWLASVFVRRPWRRRGLARTLVIHSLARVRDAGMTSAGLGVDADNPNGALRLYEETGFTPEFRSLAVRKPLP
ncbi:MAG TPA: GNAT family N-acetyltransferase [Candidatus Limnocylindria bacterium]